MGEVVKLQPVTSGAHLISAEEALERMSRLELVAVAIIGQDESGKWFIGGNCDQGQAMIMFERAKHMIVFDED